MAVIFPILSTFDAAGVNKAQRAFKSLSGVAKVGTVAFAALGAASIKYGKDAVTAAAADQKAQLKLAQTLRNVADATDEAIAATEKFITEQQFATGVSDAQLRPALENLTRATGDVTKAQNLLKLGLDVSAGSGRDLEAISLALARAQGGQFTGLQRLGIIIPENIKKSKDFGQVQEYLNDLFGGQAAVAAGTYEGKLAILGERMGEVKETLGGALIPILTRFADKIIQDVLPSIEGFVNGLTGTTSIGASFTETQIAAINFGNQVRAVIQTIVNYIPFLVKFGAALVGMFVIAKVAAAAGAIIKIVGGLVTAFQTLRKVGLAATIATAFATGGLSVAAGAAGTVAALAAIAVGFAALDKVTDKYKENVADLPKIEIAADLSAAKDFTDVVLPAVENVGSAAKKTSKAVAGIGDAAQATKDKIAGFTDELRKQTDVLDSARDAFASFKSTVKDTINGILDFSSAATAESGTFIENLVAQAAKAADFGSKVRTLLSMGLSESAIGQVLSAGADAGIKIADEIIAGGATVVDQVNTLISATASVAEELGTSAATQFYQAGITAGQALVDGVRAAIAAAGFTIDASGNILSPATESAAAAVSAVESKTKAKPKAKASSAKKPTTPAVSQGLLNKLARIPAMAAGGIVTGPTLALIGEAGPEAVVPLSGRNAGMGNTYNINVNAGMGTNGAQVGREIVDAIKKFEKTSGPVFASA
jgi:hypothetical protein